MPRALNLRQIEAFKAVIEQGTVSAAATVLNVSQPAVSKLIAHLESDVGIKLFDRFKGRLAATAQGMRLYEEIDRIFTGVRQIESAAALIRREEQGRLLVGVLPALSGAFIQRATMEFLKEHPDVYFSIQAFGSQWVVDSVLTRKLDIGVVSARVENPYVMTESLMAHPLLCIMPHGHPLSRRRVVRPEHLSGVPFVAFNAESFIGQKTAHIFAKHDVAANIVLTASITPTVCQFVAAGLGVSLVHPLFIAGIESTLTMRRFEPATAVDFLICYARDARNRRLIASFVNHLKLLAHRLSDELGEISRT